MEKILVLDFGGQYSQLIARRVRNAHVYAEIAGYDEISLDAIKEAGYKGIIFTGGPNSVNRPGSPTFAPEILDLGIPILGICYGQQLMVHLAGGVVEDAGTDSEYGRAEVCVKPSPLFANIPEKSVCWMSHTERVTTLPAGFKILAESEHCTSASVACEEKKLYGVQFHPEVTHTDYGNQILRNFLFNICACSGDWSMEDFINVTVEKFRAELAGRSVLLGLSGGVDSSVAALLLHRAVGDRLCCVFVDHGLLRKGEADFVEKTFKEGYGINFIRVNAQDRFLAKLAGVTDSEEKRKIVGAEFAHVFEEEAKKLGHVDVLAQGTIYPDVVESGNGKSATIKSHHNVGGLPKDLGFTSVAEPLRYLFKDEVREVGEKLGLPYSLVHRQPFPGPGLAVRITGEITADKVKILQDADAIFREEIEAAGCDRISSQYFAVLLDVRSVGVMGDFRTYGYTVALRAVTTDDFMTAEWTRLPYELLEKASNRIVNEVEGISRVVYDVTSKPPATIEWL